MPWECLNCGFWNDSTNQSGCLKCQLSKEEAVSLEIRLRFTCDECKHRHKYRNSCHVFVEDQLAFDSMLQQPSENIQSLYRLRVPSYVLQIGYSRCNCMHGINPRSKRFVQIQDPLEYIGEIFSHCTYLFALVKHPHDGIGSLPRYLYQHIVQMENSQETPLTTSETSAASERVIPFLPLVMRFLTLSEVAYPIQVSQAW